jgi:hypothetical protein
VGRLDRLEGALTGCGHHGGSMTLSQRAVLALLAILLQREMVETRNK